MSSATPAAGQEETPSLSSLLKESDHKPSRELTPEEFLLVKRQREELPFMLSAFPDYRKKSSEQYGFRAQFHTTCPYSGKLICYCNKFFQNGKQQRRFMQNTKSILELYCSNRPEYAREVGLTSASFQSPTFNHSIIISKDKLENIVHANSDILDAAPYNVGSSSVPSKPTEEYRAATVVEQDAIVHDPHLDFDEILGAIEQQPPVEVKPSAPKIFSESELSQIPKKRGRPRTRKLCKKCDGTDQENKLIQCLSCNMYIHTHCHDPNLDHLEQKHRDNWLCADCKICLKCRKSSSESEVIICDYCDNAYHLKCLDPPMSEAPEGLWFCEDCLENSQEGVEEFKRSKEVSKKSESDESDEEPQEKKTPKKTPTKKRKKKK